MNESAEGTSGFDVRAGLAVGILLPVLETFRRGLATWRVDFTTMFEDYFAGALLMGAAWAVRRANPWGRLLLLVAWSYVTGMMSSSFWYQLEETIRGTVGEPPVVLGVKILLWSTCVAGVVTSYRNIAHLSKLARRDLPG